MSYYQGGGGGGYTHPNTAYGSDKYNSGAVSLTIPAQATIVREDPKWSWCSTVWSILSICSCCCPCGFLALLCSIFSYVDHKTEDYEHSAYKRKCSWGCIVTGLLIGIMIITVVVIIAIYFPDRVTLYMCSYGLQKVPGIQCNNN